MTAGDFRGAEPAWLQRLGMLPNTVRQHLVARQLAEALPTGRALRVLDIGCGQGTQAIALAREGHQVIGLDHSPGMLAMAAAAAGREPPGVRDRIQLIQARADDVGQLITQSIDVACCHGVLMYADDPGLILDQITAVLVPGGIASILVRNADSLAMGPGSRGEWDTARAALHASSYTNRIGVPARADRLSDLTAELQGAGLKVREWHGVLVFCELAAMEAPAPPEAELRQILACEQEAGRTDPYRQVAAMLHLLAERRE